MKALKTSFFLTIAIACALLYWGLWTGPAEATTSSNDGWTIEKRAAARSAKPGETVKFYLTLTRTGAPVQDVTIMDIRCSSNTTQYLNITPAPSSGGGTDTSITWSGLNFNTGDSFTASYDMEVSPTAVNTSIANYSMVGGGGTHISIDNSVTTTEYNVTRGGTKGAKTQPPDPVNAGTGEFFIEPITDISMDGPAPLEFRRWFGAFLSADTGVASALGPNWMHNFDYYIKYSTYNPQVVYDQGRLVEFWTVWEDGETNYDLNYHQEPVPYELKKDSDGHFWFMDPEIEQVLHFDDQGVLMDIFDRNGNRRAITRDANGRVSQVTDGLGRTLTFTYDGSGRLSQVTDGFAPVAFAYDAQDRLTSVVDQVGQTTTYQLDSSFTAPMITAIVRPKGNVHYTQEYDAQGRVVRQTDAYGNVTTLTYDSQAEGQTDVADGFGTQSFIHEEQRKCTESTDRDGASSSFTYNDRDLLESLTDRQGDSTSYVYDDATRLPLSITNALGEAISYAYTTSQTDFTNPDSPQTTVSFTFQDLTTTTYPDGKTELATYDQAGNRTSITDRDGGTWTYTYNAAGQTRTAVNPIGGQTTYEYNNDGSLKSVSTPDRGTTNFEYDARKRVSRVNYPNGGHSEITYDDQGRIVQLLDQNGRTYLYSFDENGNLASESDPLGRATVYQYDLMDRMASVANRMGGATAFTYDALDRTASITDPVGAALTFQYDAGGRTVTITDEAGYTWRRNYDAEGKLTSIVTPLGRTTSFTRDALGRIECVSNPLGEQTCFSYDQMGLINSRTDPLGRTTTLAHNGNDFTTSVNAPGSRNAVYNRTALGTIQSLTDPNGSVWNFSQTAMGFEQTHTDPLGNAYTYAYNDLGLQTVAYPNGDALANTYDAAGNLTRAEWSDGTVIDLAYDTAYQLTSINDLSFTHNSGGMTASTSRNGFDFIASYDLERKVTTAGYAGLFNVEYQYDLRGNIVSVSDDLTNAAVEFDYDMDGRLIGIRRSSGLDTDMTWDDASRLTGIRDGSLADQTYTYDAGGQATNAELNLPLDPVGALAEREDVFAYDAASQVSVDGYDYDARGRLIESPAGTLQWDAANHLTSGGGATLTYNGMNGLDSRTTSTEQTSYYYNYAFGILPIMAERDDLAGTWKRFYVWSPGGGMLLYSIEPGAQNKVTFYHYNPMGDALFLTDSSGAVTDAYAYTPYGLRLAHQGSSDQPFTFQGQYGVRWDPAVQAYQMGARYYDPASARFLSRDPMWSIEDDVYSMNPYQYANQNPLKYIDPTGLGAGYCFGFYGGMATYRRSSNDTECPFPCKGQCKKIEVSKVMLVLGTDSGPMFAGSFLRKSYRWAKKYLESKCGKGNVITLRKPKWAALQKSLKSNKDDLAGLVVLGHGSQWGGVDVTDTEAKVGHFSKAVGKQTQIPNVFMFACYQGNAKNAERWNSVFHYNNFYGAERLLGAWGLYFSYINYVKKITCQKTWKWICIEKTDPPKPPKIVPERTEIIPGKKETPITTIIIPPK